MNVLSLLLLPLVPFYYGALLVDQFLKRRRRVRLPTPVVSIGNLTVGGTGKTPLLITLANDAAAHSKKAVILTRGYRGVGARSSDGDSDEVRLLKKDCPQTIVKANKDRVSAARQALAEGPVDVFFLDDGFQHAQLARDLDIVCIDATDPWGGGRLLPAGRLREPLNSLRRAHAVVLTRAHLVSSSGLQTIRSKISACCPQLPIFHAVHKQTLHRPPHLDEVGADTLRGQRVIALSAIGNPAAFEQDLKSYGCEVVPFRFRDHHGYTQADLKALSDCMNAQKAWGVTTEKDWVKLRTLDLSGFANRLYVLRQSFDIAPAEKPAWDKWFAKVLT